REARAAGRLKHPGVVEVFDFDEIDGRLVLAMELVEGRALSTLLHAEAPLAPARAVQIFDPLLDALAAAHEAGIVHRDLKPPNVVVDREGRVKLLDFGIARLLDGAPGDSSAGSRTLTKSGEFVGTPAYAAPEQIQGRL